LDHLVVEFAYSLPLKMKLKDDHQRKYLLRKVLSRHLPESHLNLPKKGFSIPMVPWMRGALKEWGHDVLLGDMREPFLDRTAVQKVWDSFQRGESHLINMISVLLSFKLWSSVPLNSEHASAS
jgi:asparagine synthase (glutamine-hydrolysing)